MFSLLLSAATMIGLWFGYDVTRRYVARRLRYVDAIQKPVAPVIAGLAATLVAWPVTALLPFIGAGTAIAAGVTVGMGFLQGARDARGGVLPP